MWHFREAKRRLLGSWVEGIELAEPVSSFYSRPPEAADVHSAAASGSRITPHKCCIDLQLWYFLSSNPSAPPNLSVVPLNQPFLYILSSDGVHLKHHPNLTSISLCCLLIWKQLGRLSTTLIVREVGLWRPNCRKITDVPFELGCAGNIKCGCLHGVVGCCSRKPGCPLSAAQLERSASQPLTPYCKSHDGPWSHVVSRGHMWL